MSLSVKVTGRAEFSQVKSEVRDLDRGIRAFQETMERGAERGFLSPEQQRMADLLFRQLQEGQENLNRLLDEQQRKLGDLNQKREQMDAEQRRRYDDELKRRQEIIDTYQDELNALRQRGTELSRQSTAAPAMGAPAQAGSGGGDLLSTVFGMGKTVLGLAGLGSIMGLITQGISGAYQREAGSTQLGLRMGVDDRSGFREFLHEMRQTGAYTGHTALETMQTLDVYASRAGAVDAGFDDLRAVQEFSKGYGIEAPTTAASFAEFRRAGATGVGEQREFAEMLARSINRGNMQERTVEAMETTAGLMGELASRLPEVHGASLLALQTILNETGMEAFRGERGAQQLSSLGSIFDSDSGAGDFFMLRALGWGAEEGGISYYDARYRAHEGISNPENLSDFLSYMQSMIPDEELQNLVLHQFTGMTLPMIESLRSATDNFATLMGPNVEAVMDDLREQGVLSDQFGTYKDSAYADMVNASISIEESLSEMGADILADLTTIKQYMGNILERLSGILGTNAGGEPSRIGPDYLPDALRPTTASATAAVTTGLASFGVYKFAQSLISSLKGPAVATAAASQAPGTVAGVVPWLSRLQKGGAAGTFGGFSAGLMEYYQTRQAGEDHETAYSRSLGAGGAVALALGLGFTTGGIGIPLGVLAALYGHDIGADWGEQNLQLPDEYLQARDEFDQMVKDTLSDFARRVVVDTDLEEPTRLALSQMSRPDGSGGGFSRELTSERTPVNVSGVRYEEDTPEPRDFGTITAPIERSDDPEPIVFKRMGYDTPDSVDPLPTLTYDGRRSGVRTEAGGGDDTPEPHSGRPDIISAPIERSDDPEPIVFKRMGYDTPGGLDPLPTSTERQILRHLSNIDDNTEKVPFDPTEPPSRDLPGPTSLLDWVSGDYYERTMREHGAEDALKSSGSYRDPSSGVELMLAFLRGRISLQDFLTGRMPVESAQPAPSPWQEPVQLEYETNPIPEPELTMREPEVTTQSWDPIWTEDTPYAGIIKRASEEYGIDKHIITSLIAAESSFKPESVSPVGARGLMQIMPTNFHHLGLNPASVFDPEMNIMAGTRHLRDQLDYFDGDMELAIAAYNAGMGRVRGWMERHGTTDWNEIAPHAFTETRNHVQRVLGDYVPPHERDMNLNLNVNVRVDSEGRYNMQELEEELEQTVMRLMHELKYQDIYSGTSTRGN